MDEKAKRKTRRIAWVAGFVLLDSRIHPGQARDVVSSPNRR